MEQTLPLRNEINRISYFSIIKNDSYNGIFSSKTNTPLESIEDSKTIDKIYYLIKDNYKSWKQLTTKLPKNLNYIVIFYSSEKQVLALWLKENKAIILSKPIDPRNISVIYQPGVEIVNQLKSYLNINTPKSKGSGSIENNSN